MNILIFLIVSIIFFITTYISTLSMITSLIVFIFSLFVFCLISNKRINDYVRVKRRYHSCYRFINNFIISLNVKKTVSASFETLLNQMDDEYVAEYNDLDHLNDSEKLEYLKKFYPFDIYSLFVGVIALYEEQGGNILSLSSLVMDKSRNIEEYIQNSYSLGIRKVVEFITLWIFSIVILLVLRLVLKDFYQLIVNKPFFQIIIGVLLCFIILTIHLAIHRFTSIKVRGWTNEKI